MAPRFQLLLFTTDPHMVRTAGRAGIDGIIVDWEHLGKESRQRGADTQINHDTLADLRRVRAHTDGLVLCRINQFGPHTLDEVQAALSAGADELLLPMVRTVEQAQRTLDWIGGRAGLGILIETPQAVERTAALCALPLTRVYVGLNDLSIARHTPNLFTAVADGTVESIRRRCPLPFGFAGMTLPEKGFPIPCRLLIAELARLNCAFTFLRRSFLTDIQGQDMTYQVSRMRAAMEKARHRDAAMVTRDQGALHQAIARWNPASATNHA